VARNRKRAKDRQRAAAGGARSADALSTRAVRAEAAGAEAVGAEAVGADALGSDALDEASGHVDRAEDRSAAPDPLAHATPDVELAAAQLALGRRDAPAGEALDDDELGELAVEAAPVRRGGSQNGGGDSAAVARPSTGAPAHRVSLLTRLITFIQGSWAELQRVQWPDRRQVVQATGVVIGFVIVAGLFLALSDTVSSHLMDWILK